MAADLHNITSPVAKVTAADPTYTEGDVAGLSLDTAGSLRTTGGGSGGRLIVNSSTTYVDKSITSATGASQTLADANPARLSLVIIVDTTQTTTWAINPLGTSAVSGTTPAFTLYPGDVWSPEIVPLNKITGIGTSTAKLIVLEG